MLSQTKLPKFAVPVRIAMANETQIIGAVFVYQGQRVIDLLCDERPFIPIETTAGFRLLNKQHAVEVDLMQIEEMLEKRDLFPNVDLQYLRNNKW
ncbi:MAG: hypothetical protein JJT95_00660 [Pararhodobacter sp.]|nr:hypothetical protein [Pararhodobacter sp.]